LKIEKLQRPDAIRFPIVGDCLAGLIFEDKTNVKNNIYRPDCDKIFTKENGTQVCRAYENPSIKWKFGCPLASNIIDIAVEKADRIRIGQQKTKRKK